MYEEQTGKEADLLFLLKLFHFLNTRMNKWMNKTQFSVNLNILYN